MIIVYFCILQSSNNAVGNEFCVSRLKARSTLALFYYVGRFITPGYGLVTQCLAVNWKLDQPFDVDIILQVCRVGGKTLVKLGYFPDEILSTHGHDMLRIPDQPLPLHSLKVDAKGKICSQSGTASPTPLRST